MTDQTKALLPVSQDRLIYVRWSDDGQHIRKWAHEPFEGATPLVNAGNVGMREARIQKYLVDQAGSRERLLTFPPAVRERLRRWQEGQSEWFSNTVLEIVAEFITFDDAALTPSALSGDAGEESAQRLQDHMEQHHGICLSASDWDAAIRAAHQRAGEP